MSRIRSASLMLASIISISSQAAFADVGAIGAATLNESISLPAAAQAVGAQQSANAEALNNEIQSEAKSSEQTAKVEAADKALSKAATKKLPKLPRGHQYFVCFTAQNQASVGDIRGNRDAVVIGEPGTIFSTSDKAVDLQTGTMLLSTRSMPLSITSGNCKIDLQANSSAIIDSTTLHAIECLSGSASLTKIDGTSANVSSQQQVSMNPNEPTQPVFKDPFVREVNPNKFLLSAIKQRTEALNKIPLHTLHSGLVSNSQSATSRRNSEPAKIFPSTGATFGLLGSNIMEINGGSMLVDLPQDTAIHTPFGLIQATKRSSIAIQISPASMFAGNCTISSTMVVKSNGHSIPLHVGRSVLVISGIAVPGATITDGIARRRLNAYCDGCITGITADFSVLSFVQGCQNLRRAINEPFSNRESRFGGDFLKSMAALYTVTATYGSYYATPEVPKHTQAEGFKSPPEVIALLAQNGK
ncbi:MAG TPA: hypothetical protein V6C76_06020 [Drouetiella sp.]